MVPYRARYDLTLASTASSSGVSAAGGVMLDEWDDVCDGRTEQEHFYLHLDYGEGAADRDTSDVYSTFVSWEAKDGSRYRFDMRRAGSDESFDEIKGVAGGGTVEFARPQMTVLPLARGTLFPVAYLRFLIERAEAGDRVVARDSFDGSDVDDGNLVSAVIGPGRARGAEDEAPPDSPLLDRPSWWVRSAFFPADPGNDQLPVYEQSMRVLDNGVVQEVLFDYGDYSIRATLKEIETLPRPKC
jgi:hypothetical protein